MLASVHDDVPAARDTVELRPVLADRHTGRSGDDDAAPFPVLTLPAVVAAVPPHRRAERVSNVIVAHGGVEPSVVAAGGAQEARARVPLGFGRRAVKMGLEVVEEGGAPTLEETLDERVVLDAAAAVRVAVREQCAQLLVRDLGLSFHSVRHIIATLSCGGREAGGGAILMLSFYALPRRHSQNTLYCHWSKS